MILETDPMAVFTKPALVAWRPDAILVVSSIKPHRLTLRIAGTH
jgi:hypothetical protein